MFLYAKVPKSFLLQQLYVMINIIFFYYLFSEPIYSTPNKKRHNRQPSYDGTSGPDEKTLNERRKQKALYENVRIPNGSIVQIVEQQKDVTFDSESQAFLEMLIKVRSKFKFDVSKVGGRS